MKSGLDSFASSPLTLILSKICQVVSVFHKHSKLAQHRTFWANVFLCFVDHNERTERILYHMRLCEDLTIKPTPSFLRHYFWAYKIILRMFIGFIFETVKKLEII